MKKRIIWALAALNVALLVTLVGRLTTDNAARAQAAHRPGEYILVPGDVPGGANAVVYVIDSTNGQLGAMAYDPSRKEINAMPPLELSRVFQGAAPLGAGPQIPARPGVPTRGAR